MSKSLIAKYKSRLNPHKHTDKEWFLSLLDEQKQFSYEEGHVCDVLNMLRLRYILPHQRKIEEKRRAIEELRKKEDYSAEDYRSIIALSGEISAEERALSEYKCFFSEPYFARMDVTDPREGYNSYYIGKKGDIRLEIIDWRAPLAVRYYQKSRVKFSINEYDYTTVLRRALSVKNGKLLDYKNEYLSVRDYLSAEEIAGRDEEILFDPFLRQIIKDRKDDVHIRDIIQTIQEKQFDVITRPERETFVLQGCAGSGKTMIMLHRLSYLMYNNEALRPRDVLVITPSHSFNAFIDELSQVLELQKVRTVTLQDYYFQVLKNEGIDLTDKMSGERETEEYLSYLYSPKFTKDIKKFIRKVFDGVYGLLAGEECRAVAEQICGDLTDMQKSYDRIRNASLRIRRTVLGEMKENGEGHLYFTKPFRQLMSAVYEVQDFLQFVLHGDVKTPDYFLRQFVVFYRSITYVSRHAERVLADAQADLQTLSLAVEKEILDLRRYRQKRGGEEVLTYADRIERRGELLAEISKTIALIADMGVGKDLLDEFVAVLRASSYCVRAGRCESAVDLARWLYRETVKKHKQKFGLKGIYPSDGYALCRVLLEAGRKLSPKYGLVFIDEGQDISEEEYRLLQDIHVDAAFNVFGDLKQNITFFRGVKAWQNVFDCAVYELNQNYRNTNEIVDYVASVLEVDMLPIGFHGDGVQKITRQKLTAFFKNKQGLKALIVPEGRISEFEKRGVHRPSKNGKISKSKINLMTVYESKGLEFSAVAVYQDGMTENEAYVACTRALRELAIVEERA